ncbi:MAG: FRG domain-containing protein [Bacteroidota bacterium]|nr:FRG domain-containing protein [Bacteroidota bacterium]
MPEIPEKPLETADDLWDQLSPTKRHSDSNSQIIYRGHADAEWELKPSLLREESLQLMKEFSDSPFKCEDLVWREFEDLQFFVQSCDQAGVEVPNDSLMFRKSILTKDNFRKYHEDPSTWPSDEFLEIMAFGRLHGLPTRLLDWSIDPYVAAYFAASGALLSIASGAKIGERIAIHELDFGPPDKEYLGEVRLLRIKGSISPNVVAQQGMFTVHPPVENHGEMEELRSLENYLPPLPASPIRKFTIPISQVPELYELCSTFNYNAARLYPGPEGVVRTLREHQMRKIARRMANSNCKLV